MKNSTGEMSPELSPAELTVGAIQRWYNNSERRGNQKKEEYQEELISYYTEIMSQERDKDTE